MLRFRKLGNLLTAGSLVAGLLVASNSISAVSLPATLGFKNITANNVADAAIGEAQLKVEMSCAAPTVSLKFTNAGPNASSITDIYIDESDLLAPGTITDSGDGVSFSFGASPGDLPGGNQASPPFNGTRHLAADSDKPTQPMGVNPGEWVMITYNLLGGKTCQSLSDDFDSGAFRIGIHVQGFDGGGSESFVNGPPPVVPNTAPKCVVSGNVFTITDAEGLGTISGTATNVTTNPALPYDANGATSATITASIVDQFADASLQLTVADKGGLTANCGLTKTADPKPNTPPKCVVSGNVFTITDAEGLGTISGTATNVTTNPTLPYNANGATSATITASIVDQYADASLSLIVADKDGLTALCGFSKPKTPDTAKPYCALVQKLANPTRLVVNVQDSGTGIKLVEATKATNVSIDPAMPWNGNGTKGLTTITGTKVNEALSAQLELRVTDMAGNVTLCDPVITTAVRGTGSPVESMDEAKKAPWTITQAERWVTVDGTAGNMSITFNVNGKTFAAAVRAGERKVIDIASALVAGDNKVSLTSHGKPGSEADVMIADEVAPAK